MNQTNFGPQLEDAGDLDAAGWYKVTRNNGTYFYGQWVGVLDNLQNNEPPLRFLRDGHLNQEEQIRFSETISIEPCLREYCVQHFDTAPAAGGAKQTKRKRKLKSKRKSKARKSRARKQ